MGTLGSDASISNGKLVLTGSATSYLQLPAGILGSSLGSVSIEMWITTSSVGNSAMWLRIFQFGLQSYSNTGTITFNRHDGSGSFAYESFNAYGSSVESTFSQISTPFSGQSNLHVVLVIVNGGRTKVYFNGTLVATSTGSGNVIPTGSSGEMNFIGKVPNWNGGFVGSVDEFRVWGNSLTLADIRMHYHAGPSGTRSTDLAYNASKAANGNLTM